MVVRISVLLPTPYPPLQLFLGPWTGRVGCVKITELVGAIFEVGRIVPLRIVLISKPFGTVL
jgi:hypothetical protein